MDSQKTSDLEAMHKKANEIRMSAFSSMRMISRMNAEDLKHTGYNSIDSAIRGKYDYAQKEIDKLQKEFFKKHPDK